MAGIFERNLTLKPSAMITVAERRFADADALCRTGENARANGAAYLAGFVIEILLKARLVRQFNATAKKRPHQVTDADRDVWNLIWRTHDLAAMLEKLPEFQGWLRNRGDRDGKNYVAELRKAAQWSIYARYSSRTMLISEAKDILERVRLLKEVLK